MRKNQIKTFSSSLFPLQKLITATSQKLFSSSGGRGYFSEVNILLPAEWADTECTLGRNVSESSGLPDGYDRADFTIVGPDPIRGESQPWSLQYAQCGETSEATGGVRIPAGMVVGSSNISQTAGKNRS